MSAERENARLLELARSISDGAPVDWESSAHAATDAQEVELVRRLRVVEGIVAAHRSLRLGDATCEVTLRAATTGAAGPRRSWGPLELSQKIGEGGFGEVYRARDKRLDREVALKLLRPEASAREEIATAVIEEGRLLARVRHPNVATVHGAERHAGRVGLWMELIEGRTLADLLRDQGVFGAQEAGLIGLDLCRALAAVHRAGLVHRDVKAQNVMRESGGRIVLMDFSAGRDLSRGEDQAKGRISGTPVYIAPEVFAGEPATQQADVYALGVLLYHLVTNQYPVQGSTLQELREAHARRSPRPLGELRSDLPPAFVRVVERALAADTGDRFAGAAAMEQALAAALGLEGRGERPAVSPRSGPRWLWRLGLAAAVVALAVLGGVLARRAAPGTYTVEASLFRGAQVRERLAPGDRVAVDDALSLDIKGSRPLHVYIVSEDERGAATLLFPLAGSDVTNPLAPGRVHHLPGAIAGRTQYWTVTSAGGREHFLIVASPERLQEFEAETVALVPPTVDPVQYAQLTTEAKVHLRGVAGLIEGPAHDRQAPRLSLFEQAEPLTAGSERATGVWARRIDLENPGR